MQEMRFPRRRKSTLLHAVVLGILIFVVYKLYHYGGYADPDLVTEVTTDFHPVKQNKWIVIEQKSDGSGPLCDVIPYSFREWEVVISVKKSHAINSSNPKCHYLSAEKTLSILEDNGFNEDNEWNPLLPAFLFAIKEGADVIFAPTEDQYEDDTTLLHPKILQYLNEPFSGLLYKGSHRGLFPVEYHFGCNNSHNLPKPFGSYHFYSSNPQTLTVPAVLPELGNPTQWKACNYRSPEVTIHQNTFTDFSFDGALYTSATMWGFPFFGSDNQLLFWKVILQVLLWEQKHYVTLYQGAGAQKNENIENFVITTYKKIKTITKKDFCKKKDILQCLLNLTKKLVDEDVISYKFHNLLNNWYIALVKNGYTSASKFKEIKEFEIISSIQYHPVEGSIVQNTVPKQDRYFHLLNKVKNGKLINKTLTKTEQLKVNLTSPWIQYKDVLLVVVFNNPHYEAIPYVEALYRPFFPNLIYCGPGIPSKDQYKMIEGYKFTFLSYESTPPGHAKGSFNYVCMQHAMQLGYKVGGYLAIADDLLVSVYSLQKLDPHQIWFLPPRQIRTGEITKGRECKLGMCDFFPHWHWWDDYKNETLSVLHQLKQLHHHIFAQKCFQNLILYNGAELRANGGYSDIYYIPKRLAHDFSKLAELFKSNKVFLEIAIPTIIRCLENPEEVVPIQGVTIWDKSRTEYPWRYFTVHIFLDKVYLHPVKWSYLLQEENTKYKAFYNLILTFLHDRYNRIITLH